MKQRDLWKLSRLNLFSSPVRSVLTVLGIAIGIGAVLAVLTLGSAGKAQVRSEMGKLGIDKVWLTAENGLIRNDAQLLAQALQTRAAEAVYLTARAASNQAQQEAAVIGCAQNYLAMNGMSVAKGRNLYALEWEKDSRSVLLGETLAEELQILPEGTVYLNGTPFAVRGIVKNAESFSRIEVSDAVVIPISVLEGLVGTGVHEVMLDVPMDQSPQAIGAQAKEWLDGEREVDAEVLTLQVQMDAANSVIGIFVEVLKWVAFICVLVGAIGVMNILLVSVRERTREIGIMKSLGTTHAQICKLFLAEALLYGAIGGTGGIVTGYVLVAAAGKSIGLETWVRPLECLWVFACAMAISVISGVLPAAKAASLKCVDALRQE